MLKRYRYILLCIALLSTLEVAGQIAMPDNVCIGQTRHYNVDPNPVPGSTYTWWIDGVVQVGFNTNVFDHTEHSKYFFTGGAGTGSRRMYWSKEIGAGYSQSITGPFRKCTTQPSCSVATGTITVAAPAPAAGISYTVTGTDPVAQPVTNTTGIFALLTSGVYRVTATNNAGCVSAATTITITAQVLSGYTLY